MELVIDVATLAWRIYLAFTLGLFLIAALAMVSRLFDPPEGVDRSAPLPQWKNGAWRHPQYRAVERRLSDDAARYATTSRGTRPSPSKEAPHA